MTPVETYTIAAENPQGDMQMTQPLLTLDILVDESEPLLTWDILENESVEKCEYIAGHGNRIAYQASWSVWIESHVDMLGLGLICLSV
jgi:hypothetical protein